MGHCHQDTGKCDANVNDHNIITICSPNHVLCNYCMCDVDVYGQHFISSEHAYQWKFTSHIGRRDLADEILSTSNPEQAKEVSSRVPRHMHKDWHSIKIGVMEEVLKAKLSSCSEFYKALISSKSQRLVDTVKNDRFWSCEQTPKDALSTKTDYYPGQNQLGMLLERLRDSLNCNIKSHSQTPDEHHLVINNKKVDPENQDNSSLISSTAPSITSSTPAPSPSSDNELPDEDNVYAPRSSVAVAETMDNTSEIVRGERSSEYAFSKDPSPHPSKNISSILSSKKSKIKSKTVVITKHDKKIRQIKNNS